MRTLVVTIFPWLLAALGIGYGVLFGKLRSNAAKRAQAVARKYKQQRDSSRATARILFEHQDKIQHVRRAGAEIVKKIQEAKSEEDAVEIIADLTSDWNAGL